MTPWPHYYTIQLPLGRGFNNFSRGDEKQSLFISNLLFLVFTKVSTPSRKLKKKNYYEAIIPVFKNRTKSCESQFFFFSLIKQKKK